MDGRMDGQPLCLAQSQVAVGGKMRKLPAPSVTPDPGVKRYIQHSVITKV